jgi:hypothetical protein
VLIIMVSLSSLLLVWPAPRADSVALSSKVLLLTVMPRCTIKHGQFFLTKALQSKAHFARLLGWELWPASLPSGDESAAWRWPELVLQVLVMRLPRVATDGKTEWYVWTDPEVILTHAAVLPWAEWAASDVHLVFAAADHDGSSDEANAALEVAFVRGSAVSKLFLEAWVDALDHSREERAMDSPGAALEATASLAALTSLLRDTRWRRYVRAEPRLTSDDL